MTDVTSFSAFFAGLLSFFSPCLLPMIPAYIMYISGIGDLEDARDNKEIVLQRTLGFIIGFTIIFIIMGLSASFVGKIFSQNRNLFLKLSGIIIIIFGLNYMGILKFSFLGKDKRLKAPKKVNNMLSSTFMGMAFAGGWSPCFGPVLGSILFMASIDSSVLEGGILLLIYSIGMAIPFVLTALFISKFTILLSRYEKALKIIPLIGGAVLVVFGILIFFDKLVVISSLLL
ncbi:MAG TPA: cytochrome c biogenesis protein CcdA [Soehngenia sp.]|nr:cytochrome c biogenesis protein CcdA [Soehngenia sp.]HPP31141.1 cytochrome c biogenesis protein CcdA [Soehngenia sp.]